MRRRRAANLYELEALFAEEGWPSEELVYDKEHDLYRFADGEFAFSREYANERRLRVRVGVLATSRAMGLSLGHSPGPMGQGVPRRITALTPT
jgi:hypothetical protein